MPQRRRAIIFLIIASVLWSLGGLLIKLVNWNTLAIAGMRSAITAIVLFIYLRRPHFHWSPAQIGGALAYTCTVILFESVLLGNILTALIGLPFMFGAMPDAKSWIGLARTCIRSVVLLRHDSSLKEIHQ